MPDSLWVDAVPQSLLFLSFGSVGRTEPRQSTLFGNLPATLSVVPPAPARVVRIIRVIGNIAEYLVCAKHCAGYFIFILLFDLHHHL